MNWIKDIALYASVIGLPTFVLLLIMIIRLARSGDSSVFIVITALWAGIVMAPLSVGLLIILIGNLVAG